MLQVYICQLDLDPVLCTKRNIHGRSEEEIEEIIAGWEPTPSHHPAIDATTFIQAHHQISEVEMEIVEEKDTDRQNEVPVEVRISVSKCSCKKAMYFTNNKNLNI